MMTIVWTILAVLVLLLGLSLWWLVGELAGWRPVQVESIGVTSIFAGIATATVGVGLIWWFIFLPGYPWSNEASVASYLLIAFAAGVPVYRRLDTLATEQAQVSPAASTGEPGQGAETIVPLPPKGR